MVKAVGPKPVNLLIGGVSEFTLSDVAALGVRRVSVGGGLARTAWGGFMRAAQGLVEGRFDGFRDAAAGNDLNGIFQCRMDELALLADANERAHRYLKSVATRRVFPDATALANLEAFDEPLPDQGKPALDGLRLLDESGSPATAVSNGPRYFGFVGGATLPAAAAAERLMLAWDQCASSFDNSPVSATVERIAARWIVEALNLPRDSAVGFGTSATACTMVAIAAARRALLSRKCWDFDADGLIGAPEVRVVISEMAHITVKKALRVLGFGMKRVIVAPTDEHGRIDPARMPPLDDMTIFCMHAGGRSEHGRVRPVRLVDSTRRRRARGCMWMARSGSGCVHRRKRS